MIETLEAPTEPGIYSRIPEAVYHGDRSSLSSSGARTLLKPGGPALFKHALDFGSEFKDEFDFGSVAHKYVLGEGADIVVVDADSWRTDNAKTQRAAAREQGKVAILPQDDAAAQEMAAVVRDHPEAAVLLASGRAEESLYWTDPAAWVRLRARPDWMTEIDGRVTLVDYKTSKDAAPEPFAISAARYGYHQQAAWYMAGIRELEIHPDPRFVFIAQTKARPYLVSVHEYGIEDLEVGERLNRRAIDLFARCTATGVWPGYGNYIHTMRLPLWAHYQAEAL